jgi:hypothetical protein
MRTTHKENHLIARIGWLRAAVLGANDGDHLDREPGSRRCIVGQGNVRG